jgi:hypothetical protein
MDFLDITHKSGVLLAIDAHLFRFFILFKMPSWGPFLLIFYKFFSVFVQNSEFTVNYFHNPMIGPQLASDTQANSSASRLLKITTGKRFGP